MSKHPERSEHQQDGGHGDGLVNDVVGEASALGAFAGRRQRMRYAVLPEEQLAPAFLSLSRARTI